MSTAVTSDVLAAGSTTTLATGRVLLNSVQIFGDGTNAATVTVFDNTAGSGVVLAKLLLPAATASSIYNAFTPKFAIRGDNGLTVVVTGTGASAIVTHGAA